MINSVACIQRTATFQTELVATRMSNIRNIATANWASFSFACGPRIEMKLKILKYLIHTCVSTNSRLLSLLVLDVPSDRVPL